MAEQKRTRKSTSTKKTKEPKSKSKKSSGKSKRKKDDEDFVPDAADECESVESEEEIADKQKPKKIRKIQHGTVNLFAHSNTDKLKKMIYQIVSGLKKAIMQKNDFILIFENVSYISKEIRSNNYGLVREHDREKRKMKYNLIWSELLGYTEKFVELSENHAKIFATMESLNPLANIVELPEKDDPDAYRYAPKYKYAVMSEPPKSFMDDKEKRYAEKTFREVVNPSALLTMNPKGLQFHYWSKYNENHQEFQFAGYPKAAKSESEEILTG